MQKALQKALEDSQPAVRLQAAKALWVIDHREDALSCLVDLLATPG
jgi:hypothetical protein